MFFNNYKPYLSLFTFLIVIFFLRMFLWIYADLDLGFDEAQYWDEAQFEDQTKK